MAAYILKETAYRAAVRPDGRPLIFSFQKGYDKNTYPRNEGWSLAGVGDLDKILGDIGRTCAYLEDGLTQLPGNASTAGWAQAQINKLTKPVALLQLPESAILKEPVFNLWMISRRKFESETDTRQAFSEILERWGKKVGDVLRPIEDVDLLLELDGFTGRCHNAWPSQPDQYGASVPSAKLSLLDDAALKGDSRQAPHLEAFTIEGMPSIALWKQTPASAPHEAAWTVGGKLQLMQHYWKEVFPIRALGDWRTSHDALVDQIKNRPALPAHAVMLGRPCKSASRFSHEDWVSIFGEDEYLGSLSTVAENRSGSNFRGEMLLRDCSVLSVELNDQDGMVQSDASEDAGAPRA